MARPLGSLSKNRGFRNYPNCLGCGKKLSEYRSKRCRECNALNRFKNQRVTKKCLNCGKDFTRPKAVALVQDCCKHQCGIDYWFKTHRGEAHPRWKEKGLSYSYIHAFLLKEYGNASSCVIKDETCTKNIEWASINHKSKKDKFDKSEISDFVPLCESHHVKFDYKGGHANRKKK